MYIIWNTNTNNRYAGISTDLERRFRSRMDVVTELGFDRDEMDRIVVFWGRAQVGDTEVPPNPPPPPRDVPNYGAPLNVVIDRQQINLERLLIRYLVKEFGHGGTVSNNMMAFGPYSNPTPHRITVTLNWGGFPGIAAGGQRATWAPAPDGAPW
jgi:hypothetical protein